MTPMSETTPELADCDVVLEGGVTSAVIYAGLLSRLAQSYIFCRLGGTSAGAVAAAAGAIAEHRRRRTSSSDAFDKLARFPAVLGQTDKQGRTDLLKLFQPQASTARGFRIAMAGLQRSGKGDDFQAAVAVALQAAREFPLWALLGALLGAACALRLALTALAQPIDPGPDVGGLLLLVLGLLLAAVLAPALALLAGGVIIVRAMVHNNFGLCSGLPGDGCESKALMPTLHALYQDLAMRGAGEPPVVFGDLWGPAALREGAREIDLQMITTVLNLRRPIRLPGEAGDDPLRNFFYHPGEWAKLFPADVMQWLEDMQRGGGAIVASARHSGLELRPLPEPANWPVLVAARLSLSFPGLLSAVPMYCVDLTQGVARQPSSAVAADVRFQADKVYFSDGGITSNCPIHLFDAVLPQRPTFGVNLWRLKSVAKDAPPQVWMHGEDPEPEQRLGSFNASGPLRAAAGFAAAIVQTALSWRDSLQLALPGYRERIVHIGLSAEQGGLNLWMADGTIQALGSAGAAAADRLVKEFNGVRSGGGFNTWEQHRWVRMRTGLAAIRRCLDAVAERMPSGKPSYRTLPSSEPAPAPAFADPAAAAQAQALMEGVAALMTNLDGVAPTAHLEQNAPTPVPTLRISPPW